MKNKIILIIVILISLIIIKEIYTQVNKKPTSAKSKRLTCHKEGITFEKVVKQELVRNLQQTLKSGDYKLEVWADKSKYMKSVMFEYVNVKDISKDFRKILNNNQLKSLKSNNIFVDIMVYENDKKDPGKKTKKSKLYAGYLVATFKVDKKVVYKIQTDFMDLKGKDIPARISCIVNSVMSLGE